MRPRPTSGFPNRNLNPIACEQAVAEVLKSPKVALPANYRAQIESAQGGSQNAVKLIQAAQIDVQAV